MSEYQIKYALVHVSKAPLRNTASHRSEMVSELIFGEHLRIIEETGDWYLVESTFDLYQAYVDKLQVQLIPEAIFQKIQEADSSFFLKEHTLLNLGEGKEVFAMRGSLLPLYDQGLFFSNGDWQKMPQENVFSNTAHINLIHLAKQYIGSPYLWGGRSFSGLDCSGFVQVIFRQYGINLKRDAYLQAKDGKTIHLLEESKAGDLAFFDNSEGKIIHIGILLNQETIIHASSEVRIDLIDHQGIFRKDIHKYTHQLRLIKRYSF